MQKLNWLRLLATVAIIGGAQSAFAAPIALTLVGPFQTSILGPQSASNPCIIAASTCKEPADFGYNNFFETGNISSYNMFSTDPTDQVADGVQGTPYTVAQINTITNSNPFAIAIDVNTTSANGETLQLFEVIINGVVAYNYVGPTSIAPVFNNGNGFGDWGLASIDLSSYADTDTVLFHAIWNGASDGGESFFIVGADRVVINPNCSPTAPCPPTEVPEPRSLALLGLGLLAMVYIRRQQQQKA